MNFLHGYIESASNHHENGNDFYRAQYLAVIHNVTETIMQTIYKDEFNRDESQLLTLSSSLKLKLQSNMPLIMKGLIRHMQELNPGKKALLNLVFQLAQYCLFMPASNALSGRSFIVLRSFIVFAEHNDTEQAKSHNVS